MNAPTTADLERGLTAFTRYAERELDIDANVAILVRQGRTVQAERLLRLRRLSLVMLHRDATA